MVDRETLEWLALRTVSPENYYDLADCIDICTDDDLADIIKCNGDYNKELQLEARK